MELSESLQALGPRLASPVFLLVLREYGNDPEKTIQQVVF